MDTIDFLKIREKNASWYTSVAMNNYKGYSKKVQELLRSAIKEAYEEGYLKASEDLER